MKKYLFLVAASLLLGIGSMFAQRVNIPVKSALSATYGKLTDTVTSSTAHYMVSSAIPATVNLTAVATCTKISGTISGTITVEGSLDGTNWHALRLPGTTTATESFTVTDVASQAFGWKLTDFSDVYFRVKATGGSTMNYSIGVKYYGFARQ